MVLSDYSPTLLICIIPTSITGGGGFLAPPNWPVTPGQLWPLPNQFKPCKSKSTSKFFIVYSTYSLGGTNFSSRYSTNFKILNFTHFCHSGKFLLTTKPQNQVLSGLKF